jgi:hypothetical protein
VNSMKKIYSWASCIVLSVVVLGVFSAAQSIGPESVVLKWFQAVREEKLSEAAPLLTEPIMSGPSSSLLMITYEVATADRVELLSKERQGMTAVVVAKFSKGDQSRIRSFIVRRTSNGWQIDPIATLQFLSDTGEIGYGPQ